MRNCWRIYQFGKGDLMDKYGMDTYPNFLLLSGFPALSLSDPDGSLGVGISKCVKLGIGKIS